MSSTIEFGKPRFQGILEHLERVKLFSGKAQQETDAATQFRLMMAAIYSCRAIVELMLEAAEKQEIKNFQALDAKESREQMESHIATKIPFYDLVERIRIHDFHRFGVPPPDPNFPQIMIGGPIKLIAQKGSAQIHITPQGVSKMTTGQSQIKLQRPLQVDDRGRFYDEEQQRFVTLVEILEAFLDRAPSIISEFKNGWA